MIFYLLLLQLFASGVDATQEDKKAKIRGVNLFYDGKAIPLQNIHRIYYDMEYMRYNEDDPKDLKDAVRVLNLDARYNGKRYILDGNNDKVFITLAQEIQILRNKRRIENNLEPKPLDENIKALLKEKVKKISEEVEEARKSMTDQESTQRIESRDISKLLGNTEAGPFMLILDGIPYYLAKTENGNIAEYHLADKLVKMEFKDPMNCGLPTTRSENGLVQLKLGRYYVEEFVNALYYDTQNTELIADTPSGDAICESDIIFRSGFEAAPSTSSEGALQ